MVFIAEELRAQSLTLLHPCSAVNTEGKQGYEKSDEGGAKIAFLAFS